MKHDKKIDTTQLGIQLEQVKKHRAWISGFEQGSGTVVPFGMNVRLLVMELEDILQRLKK